MIENSSHWNTKTVFPCTGVCIFTSVVANLILATTRSTENYYTKTIADIVRGAATSTVQKKNCLTTTKPTAICKQVSFLLWPIISGVERRRLLLQHRVHRGIWNRFFGTEKEPDNCWRQNGRSSASSWSVYDVGPRDMMMVFWSLEGEMLVQSAFNSCLADDLTDFGRTLNTRLAAAKHFCPRRFAKMQFKRLRGTFVFRHISIGEMPNLIAAIGCSYICAIRSL